MLGLELVLGLKSQTPLQSLFVGMYVYGSGRNHMFRVRVTVTVRVTVNMRKCLYPCQALAHALGGVASAHGRAAMCILNLISLHFAFP